MSRLHPIVDGLALCSVADTLTFPPLAGASGYVPAGWRGGNGNGFVKEFDLEVWSVGTVNLTAVELFGGVLHPLVVANFDLTGVTHGTDTLTKVAHEMLTGDGPIYFTNAGGALPVGLTAGVPYYAIKVDNDNFKVAESRELALAGTVVDLTGNGTGTHTVSDDATTSRVHWHSHGLLGAAGAIALLADKGYTSLRHKHRPGVVAYAMIATGPTDVSCRAVPVQEI